MRSWLLYIPAGFIAVDRIYIRVVLITHLSYCVRELDLIQPREVTLISSDYWLNNQGNYRQLTPLKICHKDMSHEGQTSDIKAFRAVTRAPKDVLIYCYNYVRQA